MSITDFELHNVPASRTSQAERVTTILIGAGFEFVGYDKPRLIGELHISKDPARAMTHYRQVINSGSNSGTV